MYNIATHQFVLMLISDSFISRFDDRPDATFKHIESTCKH